MSRVYHAVVALVDRPSRAARAVAMRLIDQRSTDPVNAGLHVTIASILCTKGV